MCIRDSLEERSISIYIPILRGGLAWAGQGGLNISIYPAVGGRSLACGRPKTAQNGPKPLQNCSGRIKIASNARIFRFQPPSRRCLEQMLTFMLFELKISDQYVNILSILRGEQYSISILRGARINLYKQPYLEAMCACSSAQ